MSAANNFEIKLYHVLCIGFIILFSLFTFILSINTLHIALYGQRYDAREKENQ